MSEYDYKRADGKPKTVIVTGGAGGIGAQTIKSFYSHNCNVVIADLPYAKETAENLIRTVGDSSRAMFVPANIVDWKDMQALFRKTKEAFGQVDVVIANAGLMESKGFYDFEEDESGELKEPTEAYRVLDVNLKGTMNSSRGSILLVASTSGYFGGTGVVSYISSKHGVVGLARSSQRVANQLGVRVNVVAPFFTPTHITTGYSDKWNERGLPANTVEDVADAIIATSMSPERKGHSIMVAGKVAREVETARTALTREWLGEDIANIMAEGGKFFDDMGGYTLPKARV
ncbi:NAD(P)-binding protein [Corynespora cassiicola Philippines]|uniref:NAD(P)-binding protein n=1 Tax=Corynespora cassiicola Philippines TaxID=1448308 RepID=A0A2T2NQC6_CORCC|nr:NAD(P)-binding protein [Corynespora cassiicola Philippines]